MTFSLEHRLRNPGIPRTRGYARGDHSHSCVVIGGAVSIQTTLEIEPEAQTSVFVVKQKENFEKTEARTL